MSSKNANNFCNFGKVGFVFSVGKSNLKKSIFVTSSALLLSSVCITKLYAGSACNVSSDWSGGTTPIDNSCTVSDATFNPQYSDHYVGSALADGAGTTLTLNGDLSVIKHGAMELYRWLMPVGNHIQSMSIPIHLLVHRIGETQKSLKPKLLAMTNISVLVLVKHQLVHISMSNLIILKVTILMVRHKQPILR